MKNLSTLQMVIRIAGLIQLVLGVMIWAADVDVLIMIHILIGSILTIALFGLVYQAYRAIGLQQLVILTAVWALVLPFWGMAQEKILPEAYVWVSQLLHVLSGAGAVGLAEMLAGRMGKG